ALAERRVRELPVPGAVADRVDVRDRGSAVLVGADPLPGVEGDTCLLEADAGDERCAADRDEHQVGLDAVVVAVPYDEARSGLLDARALLAELEADALLAERLRQLLRGVLVLEGDDSVEHLDDRDLAAEGGEDRGELAPDDPAAENRQAPRHLGLRQEPGRV